MINVFIDTNDFGYAMGASYKMNVEGSLQERLITPAEDLSLVSPTYVKTVDANQIALLYANKLKDKAEILINASDKETRRVNSLGLLVRELETIKNSNVEGMITCYVQEDLLKELATFRIKNYLSGEQTTKYYSDFELNLWRKAMPLIQELFLRVMFDSIEKCRVNKFNNPIQADRKVIRDAMHTLIVDSYRNETKKNAEAFASK